MRQSRFVATVAGPLLATAIALSGPAEAQVSERSFSGGRTSDLAALCAADPAAEGGLVAKGWCHGFIIGAGQYHNSLAAADPARERVFCLPEPTPTLDELRTSFVAWSRSNQQGAEEKAVDGLMRFAASTWPCPQPTRPARSRR